MKQVLSILVISMLFFANALADTFTSRVTGEKFDGYIVQKTKGNKTQVRAERKSPQYLNLADYTIDRNYIGRKNKVVAFSIDHSTGLLCQAEAFEKALITASNQGPLFVVIEIDVIEVPLDVAQRIATAIIQLETCQTIAYVKGARFGGAFSAGATIALACDKIYMQRGTAIGAAGGFAALSTPAPGKEELDAWKDFSITIAEAKKRPALLVRAMFDKSLNIVEIEHEGAKYLVSQKSTKRKTKIIRTVSDQGSLLTLTADDAVLHGLADRVVTGIDGLYADRLATKAKKARDSSMVKARRQYEKEGRSLDRVLSSVDSRKERVEALLQEANNLERDIRRIGGPLYEKHRYQYRSSDELSRHQLRKRMNDERYDILIQAMRDLRRIGKDYRKAIKIAEKNLDLQLQTGDLQAELDEAESTFNRLNTQVQNRDRNRNRGREY